MSPSSKKYVFLKGLKMKIIKIFLICILSFSLNAAEYKDQKLFGDFVDSEQIVVFCNTNGIQALAIEPNMDIQIADRKKSALSLLDSKGRPFYCPLSSDMPEPIVGKLANPSNPLVVHLQVFVLLIPIYERLNYLHFQNGLKGEKWKKERDKMMFNLVFRNKLLDKK